MKWWIVLILFVGMLVYVVVGGVIFMVLESNHEVETRNASGQLRSYFIGNNSCVTEDTFDSLLSELYTSFKQGIVPVNDTITAEDKTWTIHTSIYFATTVVTTIGYGNISPVTTAGRIFCVFFALLGIPLTLVVLVQIGIKITKIWMHFDSCLQRKLTCGFCQRHPKLMEWFRFIFLQSVCLCIFMVIPSLVFAHHEEDWTYGDGFYYSFVTLTTIGFGDYVAGFKSGREHALYRVLVAIWIFIGLAWMSSAISHIQGMLDNEVNKIEDKIEEQVKQKEADLKETNETQNIDKVGPMC